MVIGTRSDLIKYLKAFGVSGRRYENIERSFKTLCRNSPGSGVVFISYPLVPSDPDKGSIVLKRTTSGEKIVRVYPRNPVFEVYSLEGSGIKDYKPLGQEIARIKTHVKERLDVLGLGNCEIISMDADRGALPSEDRLYWGYRDSSTTGNGIMGTITVVGKGDHASITIKDIKPDNIVHDVTEFPYKSKLSL